MGCLSDELIAAAEGKEISLVDGDELDGVYEFGVRRRQRPNPIVSSREERSEGAFADGVRTRAEPFGRLRSKTTTRESSRPSRAASRSSSASSETT
ncbi:hypothetical protein C477_18075 [Haloterrigena salina JCM 13891]|uniref:Uncharacterized protein n=1 Tax=Haloterrigena salina JCM 13891 TaxID=1227488 RepID=M0BVS5_9EURY|nr:hypothetical protein C477_18075 [Haloterrigena salina JCM 13891]